LEVLFSLPGRGVYNRMGPPLEQIWIGEPLTAMQIVESTKGKQS